MKLSTLFDPRYTLAVHIVQIILILLVFILSIVRISMTEVPITRANIMSIPIVRPRPLLPSPTRSALTFIDIEHQVTYYPGIPTPDGAQGTLPKVGEPKGEHASQHVGGPLLGCSDGLGISG